MGGRSKASDQVLEERSCCETLEPQIIAWVEESVPMWIMEVYHGQEWLRGERAVVRKHWRSRGQEQRHQCGTVVLMPRVTTWRSSGPDVQSKLDADSK